MGTKLQVFNSGRAITICPNLFADDYSRNTRGKTCCLHVPNSGARVSRQPIPKLEEGSAFPSKRDKF